MDDTRSDPQDAEKYQTDASNRRGGTRRMVFPDLESMGLAIDVGKIGIWSWDIASNNLTWSSNLEELHGLPAGSFDGTFSFFEREIHPDDRARVLAAIQKCLHTHEPYSVEYRLAKRFHSAEKWISASGTVVVVDGDPVRMLGVCQDVTEQVRTENQLRLRANQQAAVARLGERALVEKDLQKLLNEIVTTVADMLEVDFVKILELLPGDMELRLRAGAGWKPELIGTALVSTGLASQAGFTLASNAPVVVEDLRSEKRFTGAPLLHDHGIVSGITAKIAGPDGRSYGVIGIHSASRHQFNAHDVSLLTSVANIIAGAIQRHQSDKRNELMIRELRHRSGNLFSQLLALFSQTVSHSRTMGDLVTKYEARVLALANAHRLITEGGWKTTSLEDLLRAMLAPDLDRISLSGPSIFLDPDLAFALSTVLHEFAANASKHGSLSAPAGRLALTWSVDRTEQGPTLFFDWHERHGPVPKRRRRRGFGTRLIDLVVERQLNGRLHRSFEADGLRCRLVIPLARERWPGSAAAEASTTQG
jgi:PAS domain S-box-containing protein